MAKLVAVDDIPKGTRLVAVEDEAPAEPFGQRLTREIGQIPRQLGLTARYGLEGLGTIPAMLGNAMQGAGLQGAGGNAGQTIANFIGFPTPQGTTENVVAEGAKMLAPGAAFIKGGQAMSQLGGVTGRVGGLLAANPAAQLESAAGSGLLGGYAKETGGGDAAQFTAALAGGIGAPLAASAIKAAPGAMMDASKRFVAAVAPNAVREQAMPQIDITISNALRPYGVTLDQLPANIQASIRNDVTEAMRQGGNLDQAALQRLAAYRMVGATPRAANLTLDPVALTQQKNLAKIGANSKDPAAQLLARAENENNATLIRNLNELGAENAPDAMTAANTIMGALSGRNEAARSNINRLYEQARGTEGRSAMLDPAAFTNTANNLLDEALLGGKLPADVRNLLNRTATGEMPLTVDVAEQFKTRLGELSRATNDRAERLALGKVREALDDTPLAGGQGQEAIDAFNRARRVNSAWMRVVERTPALQAVRDGMEPDKFVNRFVIGSGDNASLASMSQLRNLTRSNQEATGAIRGQIMAHLKNRALSGAEDEVGRFSQSAYNKALGAIGDNKLRLFFTAPEIAQMRAVGKVASYEQVQPVGSAVNNSNTAPTLMAGILDRIGSSPLLSKIPLGSTLATPIQNISIGQQARAATNIPASLVMPNIRPRNPLVISPAFGLLGVSE